MIKVESSTSQAAMPVSDNNKCIWDSKCFIVQVTHQDAASVTNQCQLNNLFGPTSTDGNPIDLPMP
jgi:hypothetical protein